MKRSHFSRLTAAGLALLLLAAPSAEALTTEQCAKLLEETYVDQVPQSVLNQPSIAEMLDALGDPYTEYFSPEEYAYFTGSMDDESLVGIGVVLVFTEEGILVEQVLKDSPAKKGGLMAGDILLQVDGVDVSWEDESSIDLLRGEEGTTVTVTYLRGGSVGTTTLTRTALVIPTATSELIDDHIGYISCSTFGFDTVAHFRNAIENYNAQADVWIVDLRSNPGGLVDAATQIANFFAGPGDMAYLRDRANYYTVYGQTKRALTNAPVIVLMNSYSASASELFASAIRDNGAGIVVGTRSYGKGVAQAIFDQTLMPFYFADGDAIKITTDRFFSPAGNTNDQIGVIPHLLVPEDMADDVAMLLAASSPSENVSHLLRLDMNWHWYIDLDVALKDEYYRDALSILLSAIPIDLDGVQLWRGSDSGWYQTTPQAVAKELSLFNRIQAFPDQNASSYGSALTVLRTYDLIHGYDDGLFHPQNTLTRAELCQLLASALNLKNADQPCPYSDVADNAWYQPAVTAMSNFGLIQGDGAGLFHPEDPIDHQQFITILGRLGKRLNMHLYDTAREDLPRNLDRDATFTSYASWARPEVWLMSNGWQGYFCQINLLWTSPAEIVPTEATTRDEAAVTLYNLLYHTGILPNKNVLTN